MDRNENTQFISEATSNTHELLTSHEKNNREFQTLPSKDNFPKKTRELIEESYQRASDAIQRITAIADFSRKIVAMIDHLPHEYEVMGKEIPISENDITGLLTKADSLFMNIRLSDKALREGRDPDDFLNRAKELIASEVGDSIFDTGPTDYDRREYGDTLNPISWLQRKIGAGSDRYQKGREQYLEKQKSRTRRYADQLVKILTHEINKKNPQIVQDRTLEHGITKNFEEAPSTQEIEASIRQILESSREELNKLQLAKQSVMLVERWMAQNRTYLEQQATNFNDSLWNELQRQLSYAQNNLAKSEAAIQMKRERLEAQKSVLLKKLVQDIQKAGDTLHTVWTPERQREGDAYYLNNAWIPREAEDLLVQLEGKLQWAGALISEETKSNGTNANSLDLNLSAAAKTVESFRNRLGYINEINTALPISQELLWHTGQFDVITRKVLGSGYLGSRKFQMDTLGEAVFNTAGIISMNKEHVIVKERGEDVEMSWDEYERWSKANGLGKDIQQEGHQVCFSEDFADNRFYDGVALVFAKNELFSRSQFMYSDGVHLFDKEYKTGRKDSKGYGVDLVEQAFVCVVHKDKRDQFLRTIHEQLQQGRWKGRVTPPEWIATHVVFIQEGEARSQLNQRINQSLQKQGLRTIQAGSFVPTGERGENATKNRERLFTYATTLELSAQKEEEARTFSPEEVVPYFQLEKLSDLEVKKIISLLSQDTQLGELFPSDVGVIERFTLSEHIRMSFNIFETYFSKNLSPETRAFVRRYILTHDTGKPISIEKKGTNEYQHDYTEPILRRVQAQLGASESAIELAVGLLHMDALGDLLKGRISIETAAEQIRDAAEKVGVPTMAFFEIVSILYMCDAGAYTTQAAKNLEGIRAYGILDHLFTFDEEKHEASFSSSTSFLYQFREKSPSDYMRELQAALQATS